MITGTLVSESLRVGAEISGVAGMKLVGVRRVEVVSASPNQPSRWTLIDFGAPDVRAGALAEAEAYALGPGVPLAQIDWPE